MNAFGHGFVELGRVSPATAEHLAELLRLALASVSQRFEDRGDGAAEHDAGKGLTS